MKCGRCGEEIKSFANCYQVRSGYLDQKGEFFARKDIEYVCKECFSE